MAGQGPAGPEHAAVLQGPAMAGRPDPRRLRGGVAGGALPGVRRGRLRSRLAGRRPQHRDLHRRVAAVPGPGRSEEHTSELQSLMRISYAVFCLTKKINHTHNTWT